MANGNNYPVTDSTGDSPIIDPLVHRDEIIIRCYGPGNVTIGLNETPVAGVGLVLEEDWTITLTGKKASSAVYAVCELGQESTLNVYLD
jgi:hypothetical protein